MTTLDDKLLGEKQENYCSSSSEDEQEEESSSSPPSSSSPLTKNPALSNSKIDINDTGRWKGYSQNTGPKGVIRDWQLYKEHEASVRVQNEAKLAEEIKKHSITCRSYADEQQDPEIDELMSDEVLQGFVNKRMGELMMKHEKPGLVTGFRELTNGDEFVDVIDEFGGRENRVIMLIYDDSNVSTRLVEGLRTVSGKHRDCQFCCVKAAVVRVSSLFKRKGVPAILVYVKGELVGNYVGVVGEIGEEFDDEELEEWLEGKGVVGKIRVGSSSISRGE